jgi:hemerythrin-like domain-containing protein
MEMEGYINKNIKDIINQYPEIGKILNEYDIACVSCNVGTCLLKDVVEVHNLTYEAEHELMKRMAKVIFHGKEVKIPKVKRKIGPAAGQIKYSPPVRKLVDEHTYIKKLLAAIPQIVESLNVAMAEDRQLIIDSIDFIRSYADKYHHAKEENILFKKFGEGLEIIKAMLDEHDIGRGHVKAVLEAVESGDNKAIKEHLTAYQELLKDHIKKEDEILYPWMDKNLTVSQVGELFNQFNEVDKRYEAISQKYEGFAKALEERFQKKEVIQNA